MAAPPPAHKGKAQPARNVITGETDAGKSMLVGALGLLLGERADKSLVRAGAGERPPRLRRDPPQVFAQGPRQVAAELAGRGLVHLAAVRVGIRDLDRR